MVAHLPPSQRINTDPVDVRLLLHEHEQGSLPSFISVPSSEVPPSPGHADPVRQHPAPPPPPPPPPTLTPPSPRWTTLRIWSTSSPMTTWRATWIRPSERTTCCRSCQKWLTAERESASRRYIVKNSAHFTYYLHVCHILDDVSRTPFCRMLCRVKICRLGLCGNILQTSLRLTSSRRKKRKSVFVEVAVCQELMEESSVLAGESYLYTVYASWI